MKFLAFQSRFSGLPVFSLSDIRKVEPDFPRIQLDRWEKKQYLQKIKREFYTLQPAAALNEQFLFFAANRMYDPSYISLEKALKFYGLIPEETFQITSVSTKKATVFATPLGSFSYQHIKPSLYFGYRLIPFGKQNILMAEPEKALLDYLYLHPELKTSDDFDGMRMNTDSFHEQIDMHKFHTYLAAFQSKALIHRATIFLSSLDHAHA